MLSADTAPYFHTCPRCGEGALERLATHDHCINCNYTGDELSQENDGLSTLCWALEAYKDDFLTRKESEKDLPAMKMAGGL